MKCRIRHLWMMGMMWKLNCDLIKFFVVNFNFFKNLKHFGITINCTWHFNFSEFLFKSIFISILYFKFAPKAFHRLGILNSLLKPSSFLFQYCLHNEATNFTFALEKCLKILTFVEGKKHAEKFRLLQKSFEFLNSHFRVRFKFIVRKLKAWKHGKWWKFDLLCKF